MTPLSAIRSRTTCTVPEAGEVLGIGRDSAYRAAHDGIIPTLRLGRRLVVPVPKLLALLGLTPDNSEAGPPARPSPPPTRTLEVPIMSQSATTSPPPASPDWASTDPDTWWTDGAERALTLLAQTGKPFTAAALRDEPYALPDPHHPGAWGALLAQAHRRGLIRPVGYTVSTVPSRHRSVVGIWVGGGAQ